MQFAVFRSRASFVLLGSAIEKERDTSPDDSRLLDVLGASAQEKAFDVRSVKRKRMATRRGLFRPGSKIRTHTKLVDSPSNPSCVGMPRYDRESRLFESHITLQLRLFAVCLPFAAKGAPVVGARDFYGHST